MIFEAIKNLRPTSAFTLSGDAYENVTWMDESTPIPSKAEVEEEAARLKQLAELMRYKQKRMHEYPPMAEYLDAVVKGDQEGIQAYIDKCLAVKEKYPKPEGV